MKTNTQKFNWILDALLFTGFLITFVMDWTGLSLHQWIGVFGGLLAIFHLSMHWDWVMAVSMRFFGKTSGQARAYFLLDMFILLGFYLIVMSGLVISTWLNLALTNYSAWAAFHEIASYVTLALVVLKIGLHWRWIVRVARQYVFAPAPRPAPQLRPAPVPAAAATTVNRRDFLKLMGIVGMASLFAFTSALNGDDETQSATAVSANLSASQSGQAATGSASTATETVNSAAANPTAIPTAASESVSVVATIPTATTTTVTTSCTSRCNKNKHCSYPGDCRRYQDSSGNGRCDLGECA